MIASVWGLVKYCLFWMVFLEYIFMNIHMRLKQVMGIIMLLVLSTS